MVELRKRCVFSQHADITRTNSQIKTINNEAPGFAPIRDPKFQENGV